MPEADERLVAALYDEYGAALLGYAQRFLGDRGRAEDVVQEVLLRAWRHPERLDPATGSPKGWLFTVARHVLTDVWRAEQARPRESAFELAVEPSVDDDVDRLVETWTLETAMSRLRPEQREVLAEVFLAGRSVAEVARRIGVPEGTVKSRTFYALRALRTVLADLGVTV